MTNSNISGYFGLLLLAGSLFFCGGTGGRVARGVTIDGVNVGGMPYAKAEQTVRKHGEAYLTVKTPQGDFKAEITVRDNLFDLVRSAKRGQSLSVSYTREWADMELFLSDVCEKNARGETDAAVEFTQNGFTYKAEEAGIACDYAKLVQDAVSALKNADEEITLRCRTVAPRVTVADLKKLTQPLSCFSTYYDDSNQPRSHNIALACERISGTVIAPRAEFSFNETVGARTEESGFQIASVIKNGEFIPGVGGGVCQASTTLFNAALRAGMKITESRAHSLSVGYVAPSLDAMVSENSDLKFMNPYDTPVYILAEAKKGSLTVRFFGLPDGKRYETESVVILRVAPPAPKIVEGDGEAVIRAEKEGIASESYLLVFDGETLVSRKRIRRDAYAAVQGILQKPPAPSAEDASLS